MDVKKEERVKIRIILVFLLTTVSGCSTVTPAVFNRAYDLSKLKTAYVVKHENSTRDIDLYIQTALTGYEVRTSSGPMEQKPNDVDFYVTYVDRWHWDLAMYLRSLDIAFFDNKTSHHIASGRFENGPFHTFPSPRKKVMEVIDSIYKR
jgi:hypothetical protein